MIRSSKRVVYSWTQSNDTLWMDLLMLHSRNRKGGTELDSTDTRHFRSIHRSTESAPEICFDFNSGKGTTDWSDIRCHVNFSLYETRKSISSLEGRPERTEGEGGGGVIMWGNVHQVNNCKMKSIKRVLAVAYIWKRAYFLTPIAAKIGKNTSQTAS